MKNNPFTLMYGITSQSVVARSENINTIVDNFTNNNSMYAYLITGIRGSGKTVLLRTIEKVFEDKADWNVVDINPQGDILSLLSHRLYNFGIAKKLLGKIKISINLGLLTITRESGDTISDSEIIIEEMISVFEKNGIKTLIAIDEVNDTLEFRKFINFYQMLISKNKSVYLLMTALKENVNSLINDKAMTFLSRAPKIELKPLSLPSVAMNYSNIFDIDFNQSAKLAKLTNGYAFAYQVLGYLLFEANKSDTDKELLKKYEKYLFENGYNKFWQDITDVERNFLIALAQSNGSKEDIINNGFLASNYSKYRNRLIEKELVYMPNHGKLAFTLPRFKEFVLLMKEFED